MNTEQNNQNDQNRKEMRINNNISSQKEVQQEPKQFLGLVIHSFFVIPFVIALCCVLLIVGVKILSSETKDVYDYLNDVKVGGQTKRWQAAFELSKILKDSRNIPQDQKFVKDMIALFEYSKHDDFRVRSYLALAMGRTHNKQYIQPLIKALQDKKKESGIPFIQALGLLKASQSMPVLKEIYDTQDSPQERLAVVSAWGLIKNERCFACLLHALEDNEPNVRWEAGVILAENGYKQSKNIIISMLSRSYWKQFHNVDKNEENHAIITAIRCAKFLNDVDVDRHIKNLAQKDSDFKVRQAAKMYGVKEKIK